MADKQPDPAQYRELVAALGRIIARTGYARVALADGGLPANAKSGLLAFLEVREAVERITGLDFEEWS